jgi:hypothetical protein
VFGFVAALGQMMMFYRPDEAVDGS